MAETTTLWVAEQIAGALWAQGVLNNEDRDEVAALITKKLTPLVRALEELQIKRYLNRPIENELLHIGRELARIKGDK